MLSVATRLTARFLDIGGGATVQKSTAHWLSIFLVFQAT
jgi:hypothetical protein